MSRHFQLRTISALFYFVCSTCIAQANSWPALANRVGPYSGIVSVADAQAAAADGFNLTVQSTYQPNVLATMKDLGINHIDIRLWNFVYSRCKAQFDAESAAGGKKRCDLSPEEQQSILRDTTSHLNDVKNDSTVAAYWILDDYPWGNISSTLSAIRGLVRNANQESGTNKPTICGIGGSLDHRTAANRSMRPDRAYINLALQNITPAACDIVAPYFYGAATENDPTWIDWTMATLMPWFMQRLQDQGFGHAVLLPVVQAFYANKRGGTTYYVQPRPQDIAAQAKTYCGSGAIALLFFSWRADEAERIYVNDADIREGVREAVTECRGQGLQFLSGTGTR